MRLGWGRDDGPFFLLVPRTQAARALRAGAHSTLHGVVFAILCLGSAVHPEEALRCVRDTRSLVLRAHGESIQLQCIMLQRHPVRGYCRTAFAVSTNRALV